MSLVIVETSTSTMTTTVFPDAESIQQLGEPVLLLLRLPFCTLVVWVVRLASQIVYYEVVPPPGGV